MNVLVAVEYNDQRVLTTRQLADSYETTPKIISQNFIRNQQYYQPGKHYFALAGIEKTDFINRLQIEDGSKKASILYLWTERGCLLHAKSLNTEKAWQVYEELLDVYFRVQEYRQKLAINASWPQVAKVVRAKIALCHEAGLRGVAARRFAFAHTEKELGVDLSPWKELLQSARSSRGRDDRNIVQDGYRVKPLEDPEGLARFIRERRLALGMSGRSVIRATGGRWTIYHLENARLVKPKPNLLLAVAQVLGIPEDEIMARAGYERIEPEEVA